MAAAKIDYLDPQVLAAIGGLDLRARMIVEGLMTGMHRSPFQGFSIEFAQHRPYVAGDDLRFLDWKVYGRTDKLYLKQYQRETNLDLVLMVDVSGSMGFGCGRELKRELKVKSQKLKVGDKKTKGQTGENVGRNAGGNVGGNVGGWRKYDHAAALAAAMGYLALEQQDRVGVVLFADQIRANVRPSNAKGHWRPILQALNSAEVDGPREEGQALRVDDKGGRNGTDLGRLLDQMAAKLTQRSLLVLISDLFDDPAGLEQGLARLHHRRHDVLVLQVMDHAELTFPYRSPSEFSGIEAEGKLNIDPAALRDAYLEALDHHQRQVIETCRKFQFDHLLLDSSESLGPPLSHLLAKRAAAIRV